MVKSVRGEVNHSHSNSPSTVCPQRCGVFAGAEFDTLFTPFDPDVDDLTLLGGFSAARFDASRRLPLILLLVVAVAVLGKGRGCFDSAFGVAGALSVAAFAAARASRS